MVYPIIFCICGLLLCLALGIILREVFTKPECDIIITGGEIDENVIAACRLSGAGNVYVLTEEYNEDSLSELSKYFKIKCVREVISVGKRDN